MAHEKALTIDDVKRVVAQVNDDDVLLVGTGVKPNPGAASGELLIMPHTDGNTVTVRNAAGTTSAATFNTSTRCLGIGAIVAPLAFLHLPAGTATIAPLQLTTGTARVPIQDGSLEYHSSHLWFSIGSTRHQLDQQAPASASFVTFNVETALSNSRRLTAGTGTSVNTATAGEIKVDLTNTGVTANTYTYATVAVDLQGRITSASNGTPPSANISGAPYLTWTGTAALSDERVLVGTTGRITVVTGVTNAVVDLVTTAVTPGIYTHTNLTVDAYGRITAASSGTVGSILTGYTNAGTTLDTALGVATAPSGTMTAGVLIGYAAGANLAATAVENAVVGAGAMQYAGNASWNVAVGRLALRGNSIATLYSGSHTVAVGYQAGQSLLTGSRNVLIGSYAGHILTTGDENVAVGYLAARYVRATGSSRNIAIGTYALEGNAAACTAHNNVAIGVAAGQAATTAYENVFIGNWVADTITTGALNVVIGGDNFRSATTAQQNVVVGQSAMLNGRGSFNVAVGRAALYGAAAGYTGEHVVAIGHTAGYSLTTGSRSVYVGSYAGQNQTTGIDNVALGYQALGNTAAAYESVAIGRASCQYASQHNNIGIGQNTLSAAAFSGTYNVAIGRNAGIATTTASYNIYVGYRAGTAGTTGSQNVVVGTDTLSQNQTGVRNVVLGHQSGMYCSTTISDVVFVGYHAGHFAGAGTNIAIGMQALRGAAAYTGYDNVAVGVSAGYNISTGRWNQFVGNYAAEQITTGEQNSVMGHGAMQNNRTGSANVAIGAFALPNNTSSTGNVGIGVGTLGGTSTNFVNCVAIGTNALAAFAPAVASSTSVAIGAYAMAGSDVATHTVSVGHAAGQYLRGAYNTALGHTALQCTLSTGPANSVAIGYQAMNRGSSGANNIAIGFTAMFGAAVAPTAYENVAIGSESIYLPTSANRNVAVGHQALRSATSASYSVAIGYQAGYSITTAGDNIAIGELALDANQTLPGLIAIGSYALTTAATNSLANTAVGFGALQLANGVVGGACANNTAVGYTALQLIRTTAVDTKSSDNTAVGYQAGYRLGIAAYSNTAIGSVALAATATCNNSTAVGHRAAELNTADYVTAIGAGALDSNTSGQYNTALGYGAGGATTSGANTYIGATAASTATGSSNTTLGYGTGPAGAASSCTLIGREAGRDITTANYTVAVGYQAGQSIGSGDHNIVMGYQSGVISTGTYNIAIGYRAMYTSALATNAHNIAMGQASLDSLTAGIANTAIGRYALRYTLGGNYNVAMGYQAGETITTGGDNVCIGYQSDCAASSASNIAVGDQAKATGATNCGQFFSGTNVNSNACYFGGGSGVAPMITLRSQTISQWSDVRIKKDISLIENGLSIVEALKPRRYRMIDDLTLSLEEEKIFQQREHFGFIAQEVRDSLHNAGFDSPHIVDDRGGEDGELWALDYSQFIAPLVKSVQELAQMVKTLQAEVAALKA